MISKLSKFFGVLVTLLIANGCALVPLTETARNEFNLQQSELARPTGLQFYISDQIILREKISKKRNQKLKDHRLIVKDKDYKNELVIKALSPGKGVEVSDDFITVNFDKKNPNATLTFRPSSEEKALGSYVLAGRKLGTSEDHLGKTYKFQDEYNGKTYYIETRASQPTLLVDKKQLHKLKKDKTTIKGSRYSDYSLLRHWFRKP